MGAAPCTNGFSPLGVFITVILPSLTASQHQPEPNCVTPAWMKSSFIFATEPRSATTFFSSAPGILSPPPFGFIHFQKCVWLKCWPALLNKATFFRNDPCTASSSDLPSHSLPLDRKSTRL